MVKNAGRNMLVERIAHLETAIPSRQKLNQTEPFDFNSEHNNGLIAAMKDELLFLRVLSFQLLLEDSPKE
jgi:hypothetical protein